MPSDSWPEESDLEVFQQAFDEADVGKQQAIPVLSAIQAFHNTGAHGIVDPSKMQDCQLKVSSFRTFTPQAANGIHTTYCKLQL